MGIVLRSAIVIGVLVYMSPYKAEQPAGKQASERSSASATAAEKALSNAADTLWQALPENTRKTVTDEAKRQVLNQVHTLLPNDPAITRKKQ